MRLRLLLLITTALGCPPPAAAQDVEDLSPAVAGAFRDWRSCLNRMIAAAPRDIPVSQAAQVVLRGCASYGQRLTALYVHSNEDVVRAMMSSTRASLERAIVAGRARADAPAPPAPPAPRPAPPAPPAPPPPQFRGHNS
jgi:hypothetical protein